MNTSISVISTLLAEIKSRLQEEIIGQDSLLENLIITIFSGGHTLLEWPPGLWKTRTIRALANIFSLENKRISFTPDLLPSDLIGSEIFRMGKGEFEMRKWPIFTNILLADEINRTPPKVQSALLEAMEEKQVTIGTTTFPLPHPFFVFATQNPLEHEGTFPLPEAQLDRFLMKIILSYPELSAEKQILQNISPQTTKNPLLSGEEIIEIQDYITKNIRIDEKIIDYILRIIWAYRNLTQQDILFGNNFPLLSYWPSTRAGLALVQTSRVQAILNGRDYVLPEDIKALVPNIINHRIWLSYEAMSENISIEQITQSLLDSVHILDN